MSKLPPVEIQEAAILQARHALWTLGNLRFKYHTTQEKIDDEIAATKARRHFLLCSRRLGKSYMLLCKAFEQAIQHKNSRILYLAPTAKDAADIGGDLALQILDDCPPNLKPEYYSQSKELKFKNGSLIRFKGVNNEHAQNLRGGAAHLVILDECGIMDNLGSVLSSVVEPMTLTTKGRIFLATTPPESPGHDSFGLYEQFARTGAVSSFTLLDAPHIDYDDKFHTLLNCGERPERIPGILRGELEPETTTAQREYFCRFVTDSDKAVFPEFDAQAEREMVKESVRPQFFDPYVCMDPGFTDATGVLFGYWDFARAKLVIEDELLVTKANTMQIAEAIKKKEAELWQGKQPFMRLSDVDKRIIADLTQLHGLAFAPVNKRDSDAAINWMRVMIRGREIEIHPRCKQTVRQWKNAIWNNSGKDFARTDIDHHFDLAAAGKYLCRSIIRTRNPYPVYHQRTPNGVWNSPKSRKRVSEGLTGNTPLGKRLRSKKT